MEGIKRGRIDEKRRRHKKNRTKSFPRSAKKAPRERGLDSVPARLSKSRWDGVLVPSSRCLLKQGMGLIPARVSRLCRTWGGSANRAQFR